MRRATATQPAVTWRLVIDLLDVLERHGYRKSPSDRDVGHAIVIVTPSSRHTREPATMTDPGNGPWRILILDADPADPKWILATVMQPDHVRPANPEAAVVDEMTAAWVMHSSEISDLLLTAMRAKCWRIDARKDT